jgi:D-sedoheptulose 7-phosphate isomerase
MKSYIEGQIKKSYETMQRIGEDENMVDMIGQVAKVIVNCYKEGGKVILAGNGGSAADAQHIAGELVNRLYFDRPGLPAIALTTDTSVLTAIGNDYDYDKVFSKQIEANGKPGDVFVGISTSGNSKNITEALKAARGKKIVTIGLTGSKIGAMDEYCDHIIKIPSLETPKIQECHVMIYHIICAIVEEVIFGKGF